MRRFVGALAFTELARSAGVLALLLALQVSAAAIPSAQAAPPTPTQFVFNVFEPGFIPVATIVTSETFHPSNVATGTWVTSVPVVGSVISSGRLTARHSATGLVAEVTQLVGTKGHGKLVLEGVNGTLDYTAQGGVRGTVSFVAAPAGLNTFNVLLLGPVPPIFFGS